MLKKSLIFGTVALFLSALIAFTGCTQATDSDTTSSVTGGRNSVYGSVNPIELQAVIDKAVELGEPISLEDGLSIIAPPPVVGSGAYTVDFKTATVRINGRVTSESGVNYNAARAAVTGPGELIIADGDFIALHDQLISPAITTLGTGIRVDYVQKLTDIIRTVQKIAVSEFIYTSTPNYDDYSKSLIPTDVDTIYVLDKVTLPNSTSIGEPTKNVVAFGTVDVIGATETKMISKTNSGAGKLTLGTSATLTSTLGGAAITIPNDGILPNIKVEAGKAISLAVEGGSPGNFSMNNLFGPGVLTLSDDFEDADVVIGGGDGNVTFTGDIETDGELSIKSTGTTTFGGLLTLGGTYTPADPINNPPDVINGKVVFKQGVALNDTAVNGLFLNGDVTLHNDIAGAVGSFYSINFGKTGSYLKLAKGKAIFVGGGLYSGTNAAAQLVESVQVLSAVDPLLDTLIVSSADNVTLQVPHAPALRDVENETKMKDAQRLSVTTGSLSIYSGTLQVDGELAIAADGGILTTDNGTPKVDGALALVDGAALYLGAAASGDRITLGGGGDPVTISGPLTGTSFSILRASGGTITMEDNSITSPGQASLTVATNALATFSVAGDLALKGVTLDIKTNGILTFKEAGNTIRLSNRAGLIVNTKEGTPKPELPVIQNATQKADVSGAADITGNGTGNTISLVSVVHNGGEAPAVIKSRAGLSLSKSSTTLVAQ